MFWKSSISLSLIRNITCKNQSSRKLFSSIPNKTSSSQVTRMKAILLREFGGPENMYIGETERPVLRDPHSVLVRIKATALNRADILQRKGKYPPPPNESQILGLEMAGEVKEIGPKVTHVKEGDMVMALLPGGGYAEYCVISERIAMKYPANLSVVEAAAIPEAFLTAYQSLFWIGELQSKQSVLIHAGASGVGTAAIQLAKKYANSVIITAGSQKKIDFCRQLGANVGINYKETTNWNETVIDSTPNREGVDLIVDFVGASFFEKNISSLRTDGKMVMLGFLGGSNLSEKVNIAPILSKRLTICGSTLRGRSQEYKEKLSQEFIEKYFHAFRNGELKPIVDRVFPWTEVVEAHKYMEANQNIGKIVLTIP